MINSTTEERSLADRIKPRLAVEAHFTRMGHTYRHSAFHYLFENRVVKPGLKLVLQTLGLYTRGVDNALRPIVREVTVSFPDLPPAFDGFRLLQISDFHIDGVDGLAEALAAKLSGLKPDACVFTGDYRFEDRGSCALIYPRMQVIIDSIDAPDGIFGILGNHDAAEIAFTLEDMGVRMLVNDASQIRRGRDQLWLVGLDDNFDYRCHDLPAALAPVPSEAFKILLAHAPELFEQAEASGVHLYLSGHTHGGQIRLPFLGAIKQNAACPKAYAHGLWQHGKLQGYTSAGVGCSSLPVRFNCPPEAILFELRRS